MEVKEGECEMGFVYVLVFVVLVVMGIVKGLNEVLNWLSECVLGLFDWCEEVYEKVGKRWEYEKEFGRRVLEMRKVWKERGRGVVMDEECGKCGRIWLECECDRECEDCGGLGDECECYGKFRRLDEEKVGGWDVCDWCGERKEVCDCMWEGKGE